MLDGDQDFPPDTVAPIAPQSGAQGRAAGIMFVTADGRMLFMHRGDGSDFPRTWGFPGGHQIEGETLEECAKREALEETGFGYQGALDLIYDDGQFRTYRASVETPFAVTLCDESTGYSWSNAAESPQPLHPGIATVFRVSSADTEYAVAELMRDGILPSPQRYANIHLAKLRVTGTGMAFRSAIEEYVFRDPAHYLTQEFLQRCNGLPVILDHPEAAILSAEEYATRSAGSVMLPYIQGDEVWCIARIYSDEAIKALGEDEVSTSPTVVLGEGAENAKVTLQDGKALLFEGKPALLCHLAIVSKAQGGRGVWDKGGPASGVEHTNEEFEMTEEEKKAKADAEAAAKAKADADGDKLDRILACMDSMGKRMDSMEAAKADADKMKADAEAKEKADAEEKAKADAEEKMKADAEKDSGKFADAQSSADRVFAAFGDSAFRPMAGEALTPYRVRLAKKMQVHSTAYKSVDLAAIARADSAGFEAIESAIYADALAASRNPVSLESGQLREMKRVGPGGHQISEFRGDPRAWRSQFMHVPRCVAFNRNPDARH